MLQTWYRSHKLLFWTPIVGIICFYIGYNWMAADLRARLSESHLPPKKGSPVREGPCRDLLNRMILEKSLPLELEAQIHNALIYNSVVKVEEKDKKWAELAIGQLLNDARAALECEYSQHMLK